MVNKFLEYIQLVFLLLADFLPHRAGAQRNIVRSKCQSQIVYVGIHEWGGYKMVREKHVHRIRPFKCGLRYQLERFVKYNGVHNLFIVVTMSDVSKCKKLDYIKDNCDLFLETDNLGKDFSGYASFYNKIKDKSNSYVILTNSSVSNVMSDSFIDEYISYMEENLDVGMLGISYNSKCYQSLKIGNFTPHLQSFFLLTTIEVLNQLVEYNGDFPGAKIGNKSLLIREGEIKMSQIILNLGYKLAVVTNDGVFKFDNNKDNWKLKNGDCRIDSLYPNAILSMKSE